MLKKEIKHRVVKILQTQQKPLDINNDDNFDMYEPIAESLSLVRRKSSVTRRIHKSETIRGTKRMSSSRIDGSFFA